MTTSTQHILLHPSNHNEQRRLSRRARKGEIIQPVKGHFIAVEQWNTLANQDKILAKIYALAYQHPKWPVSCVSAAAILGVIIDTRFYQHIHFAVDKHTASGRRKILPVRFHYIADCRPRRREDSRMVTQPFREKGKQASSGYISITETIGSFGGVLVTSPKQTIFDCIRMLPFEQALIICDKLSKKYSIDSEQLVLFMRKRMHCWKAIIAKYKMKFIDPASENGGESFCRARMIRAGFIQPNVQISVANPLSQLRRCYSTTFQSTELIRPDYVWEINRSSTAMNFLKPGKETVKIAAELDGREKYLINAKMKQRNTEDIADIILREKDRESALNLCGYKVVRFQFVEALRDDGRVMIEKLKLAGVPTVRPRERATRYRLLARVLGDPTLHKLDY